MKNPFRDWGMQKVVVVDDPAKYPPEIRKTLDGRSRRWFLRNWRVQELAPDTEPIYVKSWLYVFGVLTLMSLVMLVVTGIILAFFGPEWWLNTAIGAYADAMHYWSVQLFFLFMFVHFIAVFLTGAFRGKRWLTWMLGVLAFMTSVVTAFTGYASLQDFEAQWITTQGKDAINATGAGSLFNLLDPGQIITMHVVIFPLIVGVVVGVHLLWVRKHGIAAPYDAREEHLAPAAKEGSAMSWKHDNAQARRRWVGPLERYDLITEGIIAMIVIAVLVVGLAILLGAPLVRAVSFQSWAQADADDFVKTTLAELTGTSESATYGPPYNNGTNGVQSLGPWSPQAWGGVRMPVNPPQDFVIAPLTAYAPLNLELQDALQRWNRAGASQRRLWGGNAISSAVDLQGAKVALTGQGDTGPIPALLSAMLAMAQSGALDSQSINAPGNTYSTNYSKSLLYQADGNYLGDIASYYHLQGDQWGMMNQIGSWPGQPWLWSYTMWYNVPPWSRSSAGTDLLATAMFGLVMLVVFFLPFIPGLRSIPRGLRLYRLVWRPYYEKYGAEPKVGKAKRAEAS
ncbi:MAG: cytochrome b N-terminal domain-containing protein [Desulfobacteria bacterium]